MDKKDQLAELISNAETSFYNGQLQEAFSLSLSAMKENKTVDIQRKNFIIQGNAQVFNIKYLPTRPI